MLSRSVSAGLAVFMLSSGVPRLAAQGATAAAQSGKSGTPLPRTADGKPNLQGIWQTRNRAAYDLQDHRGQTRDARRQRRRRGRRDSRISHGRAKKKRENFANRATADPLAKCLPARRPADHVPGLPVSHLPDARPRRDHVRVVAGLPPDLHQRQASRSIGHRFLDGRLARPLGGRHAGRRRHQPQRQDVVRHGRQLSQRGAAARRALTRCSTPTPFSTRSPSRIRRCSPGRGRSACRSIGTRTWTGFSSISARRRPRKRTALFERDPRLWYPETMENLQSLAGRR